MIANAVCHILGLAIKSSMPVKINMMNVTHSLLTPKLPGKRKSYQRPGSLAEHGLSGRPANGEFLPTQVASGR